MLTVSNFVVIRAVDLQGKLPWSFILISVSIQYLRMYQELILYVGTANQIHRGTHIV